MSAEDILAQAHGHPPDLYGLYVIAAYVTTGVILAALIWATLAASRRARRALDETDRRQRA